MVGYSFLLSVGYSPLLSVGYSFLLRLVIPVLLPAGLFPFCSPLVIPGLNVAQR